MKKFTQKDLIFSVITGLLTGLIFWRIMVFLGKSAVFGIPVSASLIIIPILWVIGVNFGYFLGQWIGFFNQFGKYVAVGFTNAAVDFGILNLEIWYTKIESGWEYSVFKSISFAVAVAHSYIWNKYWVFEAGESGGGSSELIKFLGVNVFAVIVNVGVASLVVNLIHPLSGFDAKTWANIGAVVGSACALMFTFIGARMIVFKKPKCYIVNTVPKPFRG